jgi:hypothetical protein
VCIVHYTGGYVRIDDSRTDSQAHYPCGDSTFNVSVHSISVDLCEPSGLNATKLLTDTILCLLLESG